jgi:hypothetical protein
VFDESMPLLGFVRRHIEPVDVLDEALFGLIMAVGFTAAIRFGMDEMDSRTLCLSILGCNLAWALIDGSMYVMTSLYERGRVRRLGRSILQAPSEAEALRRIGAELDDRFGPVATPEERQQLCRVVLGMLPRVTARPAKITAADLLGGLSVALVVLLVTVPVIAPFFFLHDVNLGVRVANLVATGLLFLLGYRWAQHSGGHPVAVGLAVATFGFVMVVVTLLLGG